MSRENLTMSKLAGHVGVLIAGNVWMRLGEQGCGWLRPAPKALMIKRAVRRACDDVFSSPESAENLSIASLCDAIRRVEDQVVKEVYGAIQRKHTSI